MRDTKPAIIDGNAELVPATRESDWKALRDQLDRTQHALGSGVLQVVISGLMMEDLKAGCKHGEFGPALHQNCFPDLTWEEFQNTWKNAHRWMDTAKAACGILQIRHNDEFGTLRLAEVLQGEMLDLPKEAQTIQGRFIELCSGTSAKQLQLQWRGEPEKKQYHPPKVTAKQQAEAELKTAIEAGKVLLSTIQTLGHDLRTLALLPDAMRSEILEAAIEMNNKLRDITKAQKGKKK
jgi:hypothetical protein